MTKIDFEAKAVEFLKLAKLNISEGNFWLAKSYLRDAASMAQKAGHKRMAGFILLAIARVNAAAIA